MATNYEVGKASFSGIGNKNLFSNNLMTSNYSVSDDLYNNFKGAYGSDIDYGDLNSNAITLQRLYQEREANNGLFNPNKEAQIEAEILKLEKKLGKPHQSDGFEKACDFGGATGATIVNTFFSLAEGLVSFGEAVVDTAAIVATAINSQYTLRLDALNYLGCKITGKEFESLTIKMWIKTMEAVAYDATGTAFAALYDTKAMKAVDSAAAGFAKRYNPETGEQGLLYSIGKGVGYYGGMIAAGTLTAGLAPAGTVLATEAVSVGISAAAGKMGQTAQKQYSSVLKKAGFLACFFVL